MKTAIHPTREAYAELQLAYDFYNAALFGGVLPQCLLTLQRRKGMYGFFSRTRFVDRVGQKTDEIAMNPAYFASTSIEDVLSTLVHEMVHLWQHHRGAPGRRSYHNKEWSQRMVALGLQPSSTGEPGGAATGEQMNHYIMAQGQFIIRTRELLASGFALTWFDRYPAAVARSAKRGHTAAGGLMPVNTTPPPLVEVEDLDVVVEAELAQPDRSHRRKYRCASCGISAWGKPGLHLVCGSCRADMRDTAAPAGAAPGQ